jgi:hypothetical protein
MPDKIPVTVLTGLPNVSHNVDHPSRLGAHKSGLPDLCG